MLFSSLIRLILSAGPFYISSTHVLRFMVRWNVCLVCIFSVAAECAQSSQKPTGLSNHDHIPPCFLALSLPSSFKPAKSLQDKELYWISYHTRLRLLRLPQQSERGHQSYDVLICLTLRTTLSRSIEQMRVIQTPQLCLKLKQIFKFKCLSDYFKFLFMTKLSKIISIVLWL